MGTATRSSATPIARARCAPTWLSTSSGSVPMRAQLIQGFSSMFAT